MPETAQIFTGQSCMPNRRIPFSVEFLGPEKNFPGYFWRFGISNLSCNYETEFYEFCVKGFENTSPGDHYDKTIDLSALSCIITICSVTCFHQLKLEIILNDERQDVCLI